jgi:RimJ/RimL family protein N-acetyltransferase
MTTLTGTRVILRPIREDDAEALLAGTENPTSRRLTGTQHHFTLEQIQHYIRNRAGLEDRATFIITLPGDDSLRGEIVLMDIDDDNRSAGLRIALFRDEDYGQGYGSEALRLVLEYAFRGRHLHRVGLDVYDFNPRAIHVYEKVGFRREGVQRDALFYDGEFHDSILMSILEDEWQAAQG